MDLLLIRHALPVRRVVDEGTADPELQPDGHAQAQRLAEYLSVEELHAVYSSPMKRALQTAQPVATQFGLEIAVRDGLAEWDLTSKSYIPVEEMKAANSPEWQDMMRGVRPEGAPDAETFHRTVLDAIEEIVATHSGERVAIVCHGGVLSAYLSHVLEMGILPTGGFFYPNYTSIHRVIASSAGHRQIVSINETAHLRGTGLPIGMYS
jgi:2,3-bisphosphoglycerate-dependent phosphoglycerate mutase